MANKSIINEYVSKRMFSREVAKKGLEDVLVDTCFYILKELSSDMYKNGSQIRQRKYTLYCTDTLLKCIKEDVKMASKSTNVSNFIENATNSVYMLRDRLIRMSDEYTEYYTDNGKIKVKEFEDNLEKIFNKFFERKGRKNNGKY